jgi:hypothetical protein
MTRSTRSRTRGQALVEFALVIPLFLAMLFAIVDLGRVIWAANTVGNAAREAARFAIVHGERNIFCPVGPSGALTVPTASTACPFPSPSTQMVKDVASNYAVAGGSNLTITVCYGVGCTGNDSLSTNHRGEPVTVRVTSDVGLVTGGLLGFSAFEVSGSATMLVNH